MRRRGAAAGILVCGLALAAGCAVPARREAEAPVPTGQYPQVFSKKESAMEVSLKYLLYVPDAYNRTPTKWPLVLFLHGAGERGDDLERVKVHGPPKLIAQGREFPAIIVSPQCLADTWWNGRVAALEALLDEIVVRYRVDEDRVYVTGLSMGGFGTWAIAMDQPQRFAALGVICGCGDPAKAALIKHLPVWVFHGDQDPTVPLAASEEMVTALRAAGGNPKFTVYPGVGHDSWTRTYEDPAFWEWLFAQRRR